MKLAGMTLALLTILWLLSGSAAVGAKSGGAYDLIWSTVDGGGATFTTGGSYELGGTIGQQDAGTLGGGSYTLVGGFWAGAVQEPIRIYLPLVIRL